MLGALGDGSSLELFFDGELDGSSEVLSGVPARLGDFEPCASSMPSASASGLSLSDCEGPMMTPLCLESSFSNRYLCTRFRSILLPRLLMSTKGVCLEVAG